MSDIASVHVTSTPQFIRRFGTFQIGRVQPWRPHHHLASAGAVSRLFSHRLIDNLQINQRQRPPGHHPRIDTVRITRIKMRETQDRAGFRKTIAGIDIDAARHRRRRQPLRQRRPANYHFQTAKISFFRLGRGKQHLQDRRHTMCETRPLVTNQPQQIRRHITPGIDLFDTEKRRRIGKTPGMDMEHRGQWHIDVTAMKPVVGLDRTKPGQHPHRMKDKLAMRIGNRLRLARCAGGVEGGGAGPLIKIWKGEITGRRRHHLIIAADEIEWTVRYLPPVVTKQDQTHFAGDKLHHLVKQWQEVAMDENDIILGMVDGEGNLRRRQPDIDRVKDGTKHRHREERLEIAVRVPIHHGDNITLFHALRSQPSAKALQPSFKIAIAVAGQPVTHDLDIRRDLQRRAKQAFDQQRKLCR